eukprot:6712182-Heterocapsa_arctica.AAC.1
MALLWADAIPLFNCQKELVGLVPLHFAINTPALAGLISDTSAVTDSGAIFSLYHILLKLGVRFG